MQDHEGMPDEEKALLKIARRIRAQEDTRTRLEEQERETINRQRRETRREHERENGLKQRAGDFDFHDEDSKIWLKDDIDEQALVDIAKKRVHQLQNLDRSRRVAFLQHEMKRLMEFKKAVLVSRTYSRHAHRPPPHTNVNYWPQGIPCIAMRHSYMTPSCQRHRPHQRVQIAAVKIAAVVRVAGSRGIHSVSPVLTLLCL